MTTRTSCKTRVCEFTGAFGDVSTHSSSEGMRLAFPDRLCDTPGSRVQRETKPTNCDARAKTVEAWTLNTASQPEINCLKTTSVQTDGGRQQKSRSACRRHVVASAWPASKGHVHAITTVVPTSLIRVRRLDGSGPLPCHCDARNLMLGTHLRTTVS